jgi:hypothetical protein
VVIAQSFEIVADCDFFDGLSEGGHPIREGTDGDGERGVVALEGEGGILADGGAVGSFRAGGEIVLNKASSLCRKTEVGIVASGLCSSAAWFRKPRLAKRLKS